MGIIKAIRISISYGLIPMPLCPTPMHICPLYMPLCICPYTQAPMPARGTDPRHIPACMRPYTLALCIYLSLYTPYTHTLAKAPSQEWSPEEGP